MKFIMYELKNIQQKLAASQKIPVSLTKESAIGTVSDTLAKLKSVYQHFHALLLGAQLSIFLYVLSLILGLFNYLYCFGF